MSIGEHQRWRSIGGAQRRGSCLARTQGIRKGGLSRYMHEATTRRPSSIKHNTTRPVRHCSGKRGNGGELRIGDVRAPYSILAADVRFIDARKSATFVYLLVSCELHTSSSRLTGSSRATKIFTTLKTMVEDGYATRGLGVSTNEEERRSWE